MDLNNNRPEIVGYESDTSIVTGTTRNSDDVQQSPILFPGLDMLGKACRTESDEKTKQIREQDENLSPVIPVLPLKTYTKEEDITGDQSDTESTRSELLLSGVNFKTQKSGNVTKLPDETLINQGSHLPEKVEGFCDDLLENKIITKSKQHCAQNRGEKGETDKTTSTPITCTSKAIDILHDTQDSISETQDRYLSSSQTQGTASSHKILSSKSTVMSSNEEMKSYQHQNMEYSQNLFDDTQSSKNDVMKTLENSVEPTYEIDDVMSNEWNTEKSRRAQFECTKNSMTQEQGISMNCLTVSQIVGDPQDDDPSNSCMTTTQGSNTSSLSSLENINPVEDWKYLTKQQQFNREKKVLEKMENIQEKMKRDLNKTSGNSNHIDMNKVKKKYKILQSVLKQLSNYQRQERERLSTLIKKSNKGKGEKVQLRCTLHQLSARQKQLFKVFQLNKEIGEFLKTSQIEKEQNESTNKPFPQKSCFGQITPSTNHRLENAKTMNNGKYKAPPPISCNSRNLSQKDEDEQMMIPINKAISNGNHISRTNVANRQKGRNKIAIKRKIEEDKSNSPPFMHKMNMKKLEGQDKMMINADCNNVTSTYISKAQTENGKQNAVVILRNNTSSNYPVTLPKQQSILHKDTPLQGQVVIGKMKSFDLNSKATPAIGHQSNSSKIPQMIKLNNSFMPGKDKTAVTSDNVGEKTYLIVKPNINMDIGAIGQIPPDDHVFKSPPLGTLSVANENISPSTASCSDVFPVKSEEIHRRVQLRLSQSQTGINVQSMGRINLKQQGVPVDKFSYENVMTNITATDHGCVNSRKSTEITEPKTATQNFDELKYPPLNYLISKEILKPGKKLLSMTIKEKTFVGTLTENGQIESVGGEKFRSPVQWLTSVNEGQKIVKARAYREVHYLGKSLLSYVQGTASVDSEDAVFFMRKMRESAEQAENGITRIEHIVKDTHETSLESDHVTELLRNCKILLLDSSDIVPSHDLPENFWTDDFSSVRMNESFWNEVDCWG